MNGWLLIGVVYIVAVQVAVVLAPLLAPRWGIAPREAVWATIYALAVAPIMFVALVAVLLLLAAV